LENLKGLRGDNIKEMLLEIQIQLDLYQNRFHVDCFEHGNKLAGSVITANLFTSRVNQLLKRTLAPWSWSLKSVDFVVRYPIHQCWCGV
jgi:hypothetical protein